MCLVGLRTERGCARRAANRLGGRLSECFMQPIARGRESARESERAAAPRGRGNEIAAR